MGTTDGSHVPRIDGDIRPSDLHDRVEHVAVPDFDWIAGPIEAVLDAVTHHEHDKPRGRHTR